MDAPVEDIHQRYGKDPRANAAEIFVQRQSGCSRGGLGHRQRNSEDGVGAQTGLIRRAVERTEQSVDAGLIFRLHAANRVKDFAPNRIDGFGHAFAAKSRTAVAQLVRFMRTGGCARRNGSPAKSTIFEPHIDFDGRVAAAVEDFPRHDLSNSCHETP